MAKNFPFFKFVATEWLTGDIVFEDYELQGIFINLCALYWHRDGELTIEEVQKRLKTDKISELNGRFFTTDADGYIHIKFLDEQLVAVNHISKRNSENGKKGAEAKRKQATAKRPLSDRSAKLSKEEEEKEEEKEQEEEQEKDFGDFYPAMFNFLKYRIEIKKPYKSTKAINACYDNLVKLSNNNPDTAMKIVNQSIANQWQGLFELKNQPQQPKKRTFQS